MGARETCVSQTQSGNNPRHWEPQKAQLPSETRRGTQALLSPWPNLSLGHAAWRRETEQGLEPVASGWQARGSMERRDSSHSWDGHQDQQRPGLGAAESSSDPHTALGLRGRTLGKCRGEFIPPVGALLLPPVNRLAKSSPQGHRPTHRPHVGFLSFPPNSLESSLDDLKGEMVTGLSQPRSDAAPPRLC